MEFESLLRQFLSGSAAHQASTYQSLIFFLPELVMSATIMLMLAGRIIGSDRYISTHWVALFGSMTALAIVLGQFSQMTNADAAPIEIFTGLAIQDTFSAFFRALLIFAYFFVVVLAILSGIPDDEDAPDFYSLLTGALIGMMLMSSANHLLMMFVAIEMSSIPSYVLAGFLKGRRQSSEAALKFAVYGAGSAGVMLFGISLLAGMLGTAEFSELSVRCQTVFSSHAAGGMQDPAIRCLVLSLLMILVGFAFKLSAVPFHFWAPDAFHGASAEVGGFLSVASKASAFALLVRFVLSLSGDGTGTLSGVALGCGIALGVIAVVTTTFGNLAAYSQRNMKRLLAYSTIAHAGYMLMAVSALLVLESGQAAPEAGHRAIQGLIYYLCVYLFMNLAAFGIVALIRNQTFSEEIEDYKGIVETAPVLAIGMAICLFSLVGIPPLGGFYGKAFIFAAVFDATRVHWFMWIVLIAGGANTAISLYYYLRVAKVMCIESRVPNSVEVAVPAATSSGMYVMLLSGMVVFLGIVINPLSKVALHAARSFL